MHDKLHLKTCKCDDYILLGSYEGGTFLGVGSLLRNHCNHSIVSEQLAPLWRVK